MEYIVLKKSTTKQTQSMFERSGSDLEPIFLWNSRSEILLEFCSHFLTLDDPHWVAIRLARRVRRLLWNPYQFQAKLYQFCSVLKFRPNIQTDTRSGPQNGFPLPYDTPHSLVQNEYSVSEQNNKSYTSNFRLKMVRKPYRLALHIYLYNSCAVPASPSYSPWALNQLESTCGRFKVLPVT